MTSSRLGKLAVIATASGAYSALFGVGGGVVMVPLLIAWFGYGEREATGTSLLAIVIIATLAAVIQATYGNVDAARAALVGVPALAGVLVGTAAQQRLPERWISGAFALMLTVIAVQLIL